MQLIPIEDMDGEKDETTVENECAVAGKKSKLGNCEVCAISPAKYTCPRCELKTCCLDCINIHKKELECDGVRNKVKFVKMKNFSNQELQDDFNLLEKVSTSLFKYRRDPLKNSVPMFNKLPYPLHLLRKHSYMRKIQLRFLPKMFTKRKANTSCVQKNKLFWRVEWVFVSANVKHTDEKLQDTTRLGSALKAHLDKPELAYYKSRGFNQLLVLMKKEGSLTFHLFDNSLSICDNLRNKYILEFPIFYVIFDYEKDMFDIADEESSGHVILNCNSPKKSMPGKLSDIKESQPKDSSNNNDACTSVPQNINDKQNEPEHMNDISLTESNDNGILQDTLDMPDDENVIVQPKITDDGNYSSIYYEYDY